MADTITQTTIQDQARSLNATRLGELLGLLNIKEAYYIDDYNKIDPLPLIVAVSKKLFQDQRAAEISEIFGPAIETNVPDEDAFSEQIYKAWEDTVDKDKDKMANAILSLNDNGLNSLDYLRTKELQLSFPNEYLKPINPDEWDETFKELEKKYVNDEKVLLLFDQDLTNADGDRYKNGTIQGQHLILNVKSSTIKDNVYCALITHLISDTSQELIERNKIIQALNRAISEKDFFALAKDRIKSPDLFCDGIKKTLLNGYCEEIKDHSKKIIEDAQKNALQRVVDLDTYDFDHTVLRSSYSEGVWEMNTLFRIAGNIYTDEVKNLMSSSGYPKSVNPFIKKAKTISDVRFDIEPGIIPYKQKFGLRHQDIYEKGDIINQLHLPLENGDIFSITDGKNKGFYILVAQECDLMMRTAPLGSRSAETATLLKVKGFTRKELEEIIIKFYETNRFDNHFFSNKFKLDYFNYETNDIGLVKFSETYVVNLDVLDLCVFDSDGKASLDLSASLDKDLVSTAWEHRYLKTVDAFKKNADLLDKLLPEVNKMAAEIRDQIKKRITVRLGLNADLGKSDNYASRKFDFGIKRIMRLKPEGSKYLLDRYYKHLSRMAEQHDFAFEEKFIKEGLKAMQDDSIPLSKDSTNQSPTLPSKPSEQQNDNAQEQN